jgi:hypothetical protein
MGPDVGKAAEAAFPYQPSGLNAASTTMRSAATAGAGAVHPNSAETIGNTPQTDRNVSSEMNSGSVAAPVTRKKLHYDNSADAPVVEAPAPVETRVLRESHGPSGDSQVHDASTAMRGQSVITASQFCVGCHEVDLQFVAGAKKKRYRKRAGKRHQKHRISAVEGDTPPASTEGSQEAVPSMCDRGPSG